MSKDFYGEPQLKVGFTITVNRLNLHHLLNHQGANSIWFIGKNRPII